MVCFLVSVAHNCHEFLTSGDLDLRPFELTIIGCFYHGMMGTITQMLNFLSHFVFDLDTREKQTNGRTDGRASK